MQRLQPSQPHYKRTACGLVHVVSGISIKFIHILAIHQMWEPSFVLLTFHLKKCVLFFFLEKNYWTLKMIQRLSKTMSFNDIMVVWYKTMINKQTNKKQMIKLSTSSIFFFFFTGYARLKIWAIFRLLVKNRIYKSSICFT